MLYKRGLAVCLLAIMLFGGAGYKSQAQESYANSGVYNFIVRLYEVVLERQPDESGLDAWYYQLVNGGQSGAQVARDFLFSDEFKNKQYSNEQYLQILYQALFDRAPDTLGYQQWLSQLNAGVERLTICKGFVDSPEFASLCNNYGIIKGTIEVSQNGQQVYLVDQFVQRLYQGALGRAADPQGLESWKNLLLEQNAAGAEIVQGFIFSDECIKKGLSDSDFVDLLYRALFDREPDASGKESWLHLLERGLTRQYVCCGFINSDEFYKLCLKYGIEKGSAASSDIKDQNERLTIWVSDMYSYALGRKCSESELENALSLLLGRKLSGNNFVSSIFLSEEYTAKQKSNEEFLNCVYQYVLEKGTDTGDYNELLNRLVNGTSRADILQECFRMSEFSNRCNSLGILCDGVPIDIPLENGLTVFNSWSQLSDTSLSGIQSAINEFSSRNYNVGFVLVDLNSGQGICYNNNQIFYSASTIKGPYVVCLNEMVPSSVNIWGATMRSTIMISSNEGYRALRSAYGSALFSQWLNDAGCTGVNASLNYPQYTASDLAKMWIRCYSFFNSGKQNSQWCAELFTITLQSAILNTLGNQYKTYSKAGWIGEGGYLTVQNDAGIVMKTGHPYVVAIMSDAYGRVDLLENLVSTLDSAHSELIN